MKILSLFDGISCAMVALEKAGIKVERYYSSEIEENAIDISRDNYYPQVIELGDIKNIKYNSKEKYIEASEPYDDIDIFKILPNFSVDLIIGGSPCQDLSVAKKNRKGLKGKRSKLFFEYLRLIKEIKPKYFILENVASMSQKAKDEISKELGVQPIMINAGLVSAQSRKRYFWVGKRGTIETSKFVNYVPMTIPQPKDKGLYLKHILQPESEVDPKYYVSDKIAKKARCIQGTRTGDQKSRALSATMWKGAQANGMTSIRIATLNKGGQGDRIYSTEGKAINLSALGGGRGAKTGLYKIKDKVRRLTPMECERLQGLPDNYTFEASSDTQRYKMLGNAFNVDVVAHILKFIRHNHAITRKDSSSRA